MNDGQIVEENLFYDVVGMLALGWKARWVLVVFARGSGRYGVERA